MKILVDEDLPQAIVSLLKSKGIEANHVVEAGLSGKPDRMILQAAVDADAILMTADLDFSNIREYQLGSHKGIIVLRFPDYFRREQILALVNSFVDAADIPSLGGMLVVVKPGAYSVRR